MTDTTQQSAEEMLDRMYDIYLNLDGIDRIPNEARHMIFTLMQSFAKQEVERACEKQRIICADRIKDGYNLDPEPFNKVNELVYDDILYAPQPKI